jgi:hypothetical protein
VRLQRLLEIFLRWSGILVSREEADTHGQRAVLLDGETSGTQQKIPWHLRHNADAIAALAIGGHGATMCKTAERSQRMRQHLV